MKTKDLVSISSGDQQRFIEVSVKSKLVNKFSNLDWENILNNDIDGSYIEFCDNNDGFLKLNTNNIENLLNLNSEKFIPYFDKNNVWNIVFGNTWINLIKKDKSYFDLCSKHSGFKNFDSFDWVNLLGIDYNYKHLLDEYNVWDKFNGFNWADILTNHSDFIKKDDEYKSNNELLHELVDFLLPKDGLFEGDKCGGWIETVNVRLDKIEGKITSLSNAIHSNKWQGW